LARRDEERITRRDEEKLKAKRCQERPEEVGEERGGEDLWTPPQCI
jgi:hypothetical protein